jgi:hypothetical protein
MLEGTEGSAPILVRLYVQGIGVGLTLVVAGGGTARVAAAAMPPRTEFALILLFPPLDPPRG